MSDKHLKGSEWKKWDLHVHTKDTVKNDLFTSTTFEEFCKNLFLKAIDRGIAVIGITDYFNIKNYLRVKNYQNIIQSNKDFNDAQKDLISNIVLIPNVELRVLPVTDKGRLVNFHCLFNPEYVDELEDDFFSSIEMSIGDYVYPMNESGLRKLGKSKGVTDADKAYLKGIESFLVSPEQLINLFKKKKK